ncbi:hypothetical protein SETIT_6G031900v2 [Setaria italica]|uniref:Uncharacterized protein n=1 Tax=Setaria italica TaxID=4555 RepID=A0A368RHZ8_SETIT|nr:hypothetical protein SETIT_6G031900v2 [Setaria italica]
MLLFIFLPRQPSIWCLLERSSGKAPKTPNLRGKVLVLISLGGCSYISLMVPPLQHPFKGAVDPN